MDEFLSNLQKRPKTSLASRKIKHEIIARIEHPYLLSDALVTEYLSAQDWKKAIPAYVDEDHKFVRFNGEPPELALIIFNFRLLKSQNGSKTGSILRSPEDSKNAIEKVRLRERLAEEHVFQLKKTHEIEERKRVDKMAIIRNRSEINFMLRYHRLQSFSINAMENDVHEIIESAKSSRLSNCLEEELDCVLSSSDDL